MIAEDGSQGLCIDAYHDGGALSVSIVDTCRKA